ncbi:TPA: hypothetical protein N0F65_005227 [Lagenidium giganteum]|uniref:Alpha-mannosidase n=1 Tax=Lagenidium giganteum TaxID=4803 RepID=A0AAV2YN66_9STRA|nr:TPA: hypothetical protein N0F65_005227 [Lagenidium giganteum]
MRASVVFAAAAIACVAAGSDNATEPQPHAAPCDPSKWKLPVDGHYNTAGHIDPKKVNVHLIPHSHDDPGWIINVDQYYMESVQYILDTVVQELLRNPDRKFMYVEQSFFQRWWHEQSQHTKEIVKRLVREGRLDLSVNGGWVMHDEATTHYSIMVDQTAYGHQLLRDEFNVTPRIGWQIDPFGHSSTQGSLLSTGVAFDALYFARIDYEDYNKRKANKDLEFLWRPSKSRGKAWQVFTGQIQDHYEAPSHFNFERDPPIQDDPVLHDFDVCERVDLFVKECLERAKWSKAKHIFLPMGTDFTYSDAVKWFKNMDKLMHYTNQDARINVLYSNLSYYTDLKRAEGLTWSVKTDDFFPYGSDSHDFWSGYFTSRPALKKAARMSNVLLQQLRQLDAVYQSHHPADLDAITRAVGLIQHHDGISGTEKQRVADDYVLRVNEGILAAEKALNEVLFVIGEKEPYRFCTQTNVSICEVSTKNAKFEVFVHNALPRTSIQTIIVPVSSKSAKVKALSGSVSVRSQEVHRSIIVHPRKHEEAEFQLTFNAELAPLSSSRFLVTQDSLNGDADVERESDASADITGPIVTLENDLVRAEINTQSGSVVSITNKKENMKLPLTSSIEYYRSYQDDHGHPSGAYAFHPQSKKTYPVADETVSIIDTTVGASGNTHVAFKIGEWATVLYKVNDGSQFLEMEWTVGPIPIKDKIGKEVIVRLDTQKTIRSNATWFTDSNGLEFVTRVRNHRDTWNLTLHDDQDFVAANYVPITTGLYIKDDKYQLNVVTDRAQGASSLEDGQVEIMVHRRLLADDNKGVNEHLNETETFVDPVTKKTVTSGLIVRGSLFINVDNAATGMRSIRTEMEKQFFTPLVLFRKATAADDEMVNAKVPWLKISQFPENVGLTSLVELTKQCLMVRLTHLFAVDEHPTLSRPVVVDFAKLFKANSASVQSVRERSLTGVWGPDATVSAMEKALEWKAEGEEDAISDETLYKPKSVMGTSVELQAMEVRTFEVCLGKANELPETDVPSVTKASPNVVSEVLAIE